MRELEFLQDATTAQEIFKQYNKKGYTKRAIYLNHITGVVHVSYNHFVKMLKVDVSDYEKLVKEFQQRQRESYEEYLKRRSRKRLK